MLGGGKRLKSEKNEQAKKIVDIFPHWSSGDAPSIYARLEGNSELVLHIVDGP